MLLSFSGQLVSLTTFLRAIMMYFFQWADLETTSADHPSCEHDAPFLQRFLPAENWLWNGEAVWDEEIHRVVSALRVIF